MYQRSGAAEGHSNWGGVASFGYTVIDLISECKGVSGRFTSSLLHLLMLSLSSKTFYAFHFLIYGRLHRN
ncbi:hypothetical protein E2C01_072851 [Portunus trituberculatus]|uniref:Uncharacterized protein n=1 Tax=Portunus trituberculatus TaxID=210409 RepID=A0A5B7I8Z4_PORTR|nr:hypothetical protein [Portunus trituberculatus]